MQLMIIDDSPTMRKIIGVTLTNNGYSFIEAENGQDALDKLAVNKIDLFIVDINMPVMNGIDFVKNVRKLPAYAKTPIIILTTETEKNMMDKGKEAGADAWIIKPFESDELAKLIKNYIK